MATEAILLRAPRECGSWVWWLDERAIGPLEQAEAVARITVVTARHGLLEPKIVTCEWEVDGRVVPRAFAEAEVVGAIDPAELVARLMAACPTYLPSTARIGEMVVTGTGVWIDAAGAAHSEVGLLQLTVETVLDDPSVGVEVFHDVWMTHDFRGNSHPELYVRNAPRLSGMLAELSAILGVEAEPGEATPFGHAVGYRIENASGYDRIPLDVSGLIKNRLMG